MVFITVIGNDIQRVLSLIKRECYMTKYRDHVKERRIRPSRERTLRKNYIRWSMWKKHCNNLIASVEKNRRKSRAPKQLGNLL
jgi:hypothetical protein